MALGIGIFAMDVIRLACMAYDDIMAFGVMNMDIACADYDLQLVSTYQVFCCAFVFGVGCFHYQLYYTQLFYFAPIYFF